MTERFGRDYFYGFKESNYYDYEKMNPSKLFKNVISFIKNQNIRGKFLDVGCAFGLLLKEVSPLFNELHGFDISEFAIKKAKQKIPKANLKVVDLEKSLPYSNESFDCIVALDVLEHTKNFEKNFEKIVKKLKRGGYLILSVPIDTWLRKFFGFLDKDKTHISILKEDKLFQIVKKNKLKVISKRYFFPLPLIYKIPYIPFEIELMLKKE
ncbi:MAG: methyltransferase domain-containing protein [Candidatus Aenigmarchaeota archaeon]|nr:methyltransferase domain-containing protein [Candidatus Aenigmarchaeota archaeon]